MKLKFWDKNTRYNFYTHKNITLEKGEEFCPKCKGTGAVQKINPYFRKKKIGLMCDLCAGEGKMDWVSYVMRKKKPTYSIGEVYENNNELYVYTGSGEWKLLGPNIVQTVTNNNKKED